MRLAEGALRDGLADAWERWAHRCAELTPTQRHTATPSAGRDLQSLVAHVCPEHTTES